MAQRTITDMEGFELGTPALVCRWRLYHQHLPLENRHLRALLARRVQGEPVSSELAAWAKQHLEWTLADGSAAHPCGVLMLLVDQDGRAAMTVGPYAPLADDALPALLHRAAQSAEEARATGVAPETIWLARDDALLWDPGAGCAPSGAASLVGQLAQTLGIKVGVHEGLLDALYNDAVAFDEAFLVSDEHGVVPARDAQGPHGGRMARGYQKLLAAMH